jgi:hypothetical protein
VPEINEYETHKERCFGGSLQRCERLARRSCDRSYDPRRVPVIVSDARIQFTGAPSPLRVGALGSGPIKLSAI